ncbi:kinesin-like protein KIF21A isoform X3 [Eurytemora carolleeae]|uniref:kinesin-like protein KIF21A isoform X3 n=1 Tax=Eurytemora carolleeae TaxID=1294199 RepID=UPI000C767533|nr:kinesin-like protein KIF21A isoform X3 [Eurytemora carolleeae]|eukprot:XP_023331302.1 kinesin-like protein KIF21A isoform X3 [Eurytemora affinis]
MDEEGSSVRVAVRIRPQLSREIIDACKICTYKTPGEPQAWIGSDKSFTYDFVFDTDSRQEEVYDETVKDLIEGCFEGYNATVLAYGQTGSGKTFTMGTGFELDSQPGQLGIIPRAVRHLFDGISQRQEEARENGMTPPEFKVSLQFMELYNEEILDLFDATTSKAKKSGIRIHEDSNGTIYTLGMTSKNVKSEEETLNCLRSGAFNRTTASTNMNDQSSRSHAIFTLYIQQQRQSRTDLHLGDDDAEVMPSNEDVEHLSAKFHFVDLAGSERLKRTGATGDRAKEGISINCGLLALGNVISALGDTNRKASHVPYRDSKLTRLLQDSLGGNSRTLMIACVSPSDRDFMETLNTLKYANRARNIKNKVTANQDKTSRTIIQLRMEIQNLQLELMEYKQGKRVVGEDGGVDGLNDMYHENKLLSKETQNLRTRIKAMQETIDHLTSKNAQLLAEKEAGNWLGAGDAKDDITGMISKYMSEIEDLRTKLCQSENLCEQLRKENSKVKRLSNGFNNSFNTPWLNDSTTEESGYSVKELINIAKNELEQKREKVRKSSKIKEEEKEGTSLLEKVDPEKDVDESIIEEDEGEGEHADDEDDDSDTDTETDVKTNQLDEELVELTSEISLKQKLIEELENSQKRMEVMKHQYESKLQELQKRIMSTQEERDKVLKNLAGTRGSPPTQQISKIKVEYQDKIDKMQNELKKLQAAQKEHAKLLKSQGQYEKQLVKLKSDVMDMKRAKVRLVQQMKEETNRHRDAEGRKNRELAQLKKESRRHESLIKNLETEKRIKETILKRKQEEVMNLRKTARRASTMARKNEKFSSKTAKLKWTDIEKNITKVALNKQAVSQMENDMDRWLQEREKLSHRLEKLSQKRRRLLLEKGDSSLVMDLDDQMESVKANINYLHDNILECQQNILQMEQAAGQEEEDDEDEMKKILDVSELKAEEAKYLLEKLLSMTVNQTCLATQKEGRIRELDNQIQQAHRQNAMHQQLLQHMIEQQDLEIYDLMLQNEEDDTSASDDEESRPVLHLPLVASVKLDDDTGTGSDSSLGRREKARRRNLNKDDLLFNDLDMPGGMSESLMLPPKVVSRLPKSVSALNGGHQVPFSRSLSFTRAPTNPMVRSYSFTKNPGPESLMTMSMDQATLSRLAPVFQPSPVLTRRSLDRPSIRKYNSALRLDESPPGSPSAYRRSNSREESSGKNVFSRLIAGTNIGEKQSHSKGNINPYQGRIGGKSPLICTHVAEGHNRPVLSVFATDELLFSASKDQTVKVWDLCRGEEVQSLEGHPNNVVCVKYSEPQRIVYTVSSAFIKVWDLRMKPSACIKTLSSSGLTTNGPVVLNNGSSSSRSLAMPPGETAINDICLTPSGYGLFSAAADKVRIWDLRKFHSIGKLSGGHQAAIMCLAIGPTRDLDNNYVITGSKDHYIKIFEVPEGKGGVIPPKMNLNPPHYDGIQCMTVLGDTLFSASRDTCIKKWNLRSQELVKSLNNAHKDWICGLSFLPGENVVISGCRGGSIKLWNTDTCALVGEMKAHNSSINTITTNSSHIFTASNDGHIGTVQVVL